MTITVQLPQPVGILVLLLREGGLSSEESMTALAEGWSADQGSTYQ
ncbi:hypothetical protein ABNB59_17050 [Paenibacillus larvae]|uniref:Uncharacterized protein n=3 Tax=Paenibacillus larvae TaxID=1464 RepID=V9W914_9BACL|nr:hypothetical protein [Paenibacillus larvae]AHD06190.1 hypothetical protein ERIC2_c24001 [Paenibacillus larvae subsp. larvae DSM 25430]AVF21745.1 hypothetical protein ERICI_01879 [Paenibacillus larvae subsp. larvae]AVG12726.1 hypothetical protein ERICII_02359 [Paenibacillus larvae subsp. larvae DSM 25430]ETK27561.1 hypothetical protein ERIC1_1c10070 [Paenibacillus larvae subsp. larvae DSM 25719]MCY7478828.1 hypothetical protein [Paenibacillus larvae]